MINDILDKMIQEEIDKGIQEFKEDYTKVHRELKNSQAKIRELTKENEDFRKLKSQLDQFAQFKKYINESNFEETLSHMELKSQKIDYSGMHSERIPLWFKLLNTYYDDKEQLFTLMDMFDIDYPYWAKTYVNPQNYGENELDLIFNYLGKMYVCNSCIFSHNMGFFYNEINKHRGNVNDLFRECYVEIPWNLFLQNKLLTNEKYFPKLIDALKSKRSNSTYFFMIQNYQSLNSNQISEIALHLPEKQFYDEHQSFVKMNKDIFKLRPELAKRYENKITDNKFSTFDFINYPKEMQIQFVKAPTRSYRDSFTLINRMDITLEEKKQLLTEVGNLLLDEVNE